MDKEKRIELGLRLIPQWERNVEFIKERIVIQGEPNFNSGLCGRYYYKLDVELEQEKIYRGIAILRELGHDYIRL
jgi:hypothetical protein